MRGHTRGDEAPWVRLRDDESFRAVVRQYRPMILSTCVRMLRNYADAEEVAQECFEILATSETRPRDGALGPWLHGVAVRRARMRRRSDGRRAVRETVFAEAQPQSTLTAWDDVQQELDEIVSELPEEFRTPLIARFYEGKPYRAIAKELGIPRSTVRDRVARALQEMRESLRCRRINLSVAAMAALLQANLSRATVLSSGFAGVHGILGARVATTGLLAALVLFGFGWSRQWIERTPTPPVVAPGATVVLNSPTPRQEGELGRRAAILPDITGNGTPEVVLGAPRESAGPGFENAGRVHVYDSLDGQLLASLNSPHPQPVSGAWGAGEAGDFGRDVAAIEDLDGNGYPEIVVGAPREDSEDYRESGRVYVFDGARRELIRTHESPNPQDYSNFGCTLAVLPDVDGDGIEDLAVGAEQESPAGVNAAGRVYVFSGVTGRLLYGLASPDGAGAHVFGQSLASVPDVDGDGIADLAVGQGMSQLDHAHLFSGATGRHLRTLFSPAVPHGGSFGGRVAGIPPHCGFPGSLLVAASGESVEGSIEAGRVYVIDGSTGAVTCELRAPDPVSYAAFGLDAHAAADISGDGIPDFVVGSAYTRADGSPPTSDTKSLHRPGAAYIFSAANGQCLGVLNSPNLEAEGYFGHFEITSLPDTNGDGLAEILVTAPTESVGAVTHCGRAYILFSPFLPTTASPDPSQALARRIPQG